MHMDIVERFYTFSDKKKNLNIIGLLTLKTMKQNALHKGRRRRFKYINFLIKSIDF